MLNQKLNHFPTITNIDVVAMKVASCFSLTRDMFVGKSDVLILSTYKYAFSHVKFDL